MKISPAVRFVSTFAISTAVVAVAPLAKAQSDVRGAPMLGEKRTLVIDDLSGFHASSLGGVSYAGVIGFNTQALNIDATAGSGSTTYHSTSVWFAPSADYFVINHLSIGGLVEIAHTSTSTTLNDGAGQSQTTDGPGRTSFTLLPRIGWMFPITERFGIWPRLGLGYESQTNIAVQKYSAFVMDLDVGFVYRINQTFFLNGRPELTFAPGSASVTTGNLTQSLSGTQFQFALTGGVGIMWDL